MNELRLKYQKETGIDVHHLGQNLDLSSFYRIKDYLEWLENKLGQELGHHY